MSPVTVIITIAAYFIILLTIGRLAARGGADSTFFTGDRRAPWPVVAVAMMGAAISGVTFISVPGMVAAKGYAYLQMALGFIVGYLAIALLLVPLFYRRRLVSIYGYLSQRFGPGSHAAGAWLFIISKMTGAAVRFFVVCAVLQLLVCAPLGIPFEINVIATLALVWLYTAGGGVKSLIWTDFLKSFCLVGSVALCIWFIASELGIGLADLPAAVASHSSARIFFFDNPMEPTYFWKQFIAGIFMAIATNGLDQDMMQRHLACADSTASRKNMVTSGIMQFLVIALFLVLGTMLLLYASHAAIPAPERPDDLFGLIAAHPSMPPIAGILFILGLVSAAYSAAGSALTSLTTSMTVDIIKAPERMSPEQATFSRRLVHLAMTAVMALVIIAFYRLSNDDAISAVYTLASYTYGPILGLFAFGLMTRRAVADRAVPYVCALAPLLSWILQWTLQHFTGYATGFELLLFNAAFTMAGLAILSRSSIPSPTPALR
ncbi:MAG: sodium:solute symporter [Pseudoflavonifractor sp.]|nr:sodium:solute symporter [Alloprevotella sp.]MCM1117510.1 sodium:solute symporter [Pseudoflavonifractor sp.]